MIAALDAEYQALSVPTRLPATEVVATIAAPSPGPVAAHVSVMRRTLPTQISSARSKGISDADAGPALLWR